MRRTAQVLPHLIQAVHQLWCDERAATHAEYPSPSHTEVALHHDSWFAVDYLELIAGTSTSRHHII
jgi:hypothetical protein